MRILMLAAVAFSSSAFAQSSTTQCQTDYFGNVTCQTSRDPGIDWSRAQQPQPNPGDAFNKSFSEAQTRRRERERDEMLRDAISRNQPPAPPAADLAEACEREFGKALSAGKMELAEAIISLCREKLPAK